MPEEVITETGRQGEVPQPPRDTDPASTRLNGFAKGVVGQPGVGSSVEYGLTAAAAYSDQSAEQAELAKVVEGQLGSLVSDTDRSKPFRSVVNSERLYQVMASAQLTGQQPNAVLFWGPHPTHEDGNLKRPDKRTIAMVGELFADLDLKPRITVLLADTHGEFNGIHNPDYLARVKEGFDGSLGDRVNARYLSELYTAHGLSENPEPARGIPGADTDHPIYESLRRGARNRRQDFSHAMRYATMRLQEGPLISDLVGEKGVFLVIGDPDSAPLFQIEQPIVFSRAREKSGSKYTDRAPWIPRG